MSDAKLNDFVASGTNAARLAFTPSPPTPASGPSPAYFWKETDTGNYYGWDPTNGTWSQINTGGATGANPTATASDVAVNGSAGTFMRSDGAPAVQKCSSAVFGLCKVDNTTITASGGVITSVGSGALTLITETVTTSSASNVTFSSIANTYRDLEIRVRGRGDTGANDVDVYLQFNGDTGNNYSSFMIIQFTGTDSKTEVIAGDHIDLGRIAASSAPANAVGFQKIVVSDYKGTTWNKEVRAEGAYRRNTTSGNVFVTQGQGEWVATTAINAVKVYLSAGNFVDGTIVSLYGRM